MYFGATVNVVKRKYTEKRVAYRQVRVVVSYFGDDGLAYSEEGHMFRTLALTGNSMT
jgi:hypothetical protein